MDHFKILKAISHKTRFNILVWLKEPENNFKEFGWQPHVTEPEFINSVCVYHIQLKTGNSQSTTSENLAILEKAGLLQSKKVASWTLYQRNEKVIEEFSEWIGNAL
ncbi:helix-turn-helix transcriptional regulator [Priestia megaterium]|nr:helix-turn-helix transcriptional regulator [Priestia megaterium]